MRKDTFKKYMLLITYTLVLAFVLVNIKSIGSGVGKGFSVLSPLWFGIALAFILNVPMSIIEKKVFGKTNKRVRIVSLVLSILIVVLFMTVLFVWVIPDFISSISYLVGQLPSLVNELNEFLQKTFADTSLSSYLNNFSGSSEVTETLSSLFKYVVNNFSTVLSNFAGFLINLFTGTVISVYLLFSKEKLLKSCNKMINRVFDEKFVEKLDNVFKLANKSFHDFITYQCLECIILGTIMFIAFSIFRFPYALTIAFLTSVTAIVPFFGATVACIIGAILIGTSSIQQAILFVIVFQVVQQIENNLIYPRVVGKNVGLPPVLSIMAIIVGGNIAGFLGMILCIPVTSILYSLIKTAIKEDNIPRIKVPNFKKL